MNSFVTNKIRSLNESFVTEAALLSNARMYEKMLFKGISSNECFLAMFASVEDVIMNLFVTRQATFG